LVRLQGELADAYHALATQVSDHPLLIPDTVARIPLVGRALHDEMTAYWENPTLMTQQMKEWLEPWLNGLAGMVGQIGRNIALDHHIPAPLQGVSALNDTQHDHDDRYNQKNVDEPAYCVRGNQTQYPEDDKDDSNRFKHFCFSDQLFSSVLLPPCSQSGPGCTDQRC
jgi:hypothetical protein